MGWAVCTELLPPAVVAQLLVHLELDDVLSAYAPDAGRAPKRSTGLST